MLEGRHYQNAYVTRNLDAAIDAFGRRGHVRKLIRYDGSVEVATPAGRGLSTTRLAFAWVEDLQYELIEPVAGVVDIYREALAGDDRLSFHHACMRVDDWTDFRRRVDQQDLPVVLEGGSDQLRFVYLDARGLLGHYLEYTWMTDARWTQMGGR